VVGKVGRAETSTDPAPVNMSETTITFKPKDQWPKGLTKDAILARLDEKLQIPGVTNIWTQPIRNRIDMLSTGIRTQIGIKVFGPDLSVIEAKSEEIKEVVAQVPGAVDLYAERTTGSPYLEMTVDRAAADRYGLNVADVEDVIETAIGGKNLTTTIEGRQRFPVRVRAETAGRAVTVDFSNIRLDLPNPQLFFPPAGFTKFPSSMALINELMIRESASRSGPSGPMAAPVQTDEHPIGMPGLNKY